MEPNAAVALIHTEGTDPDFLIIERAHKISDPWSGQLAFPGGRRESVDADLLATGIRETFEETGIQLAPDSCAGPLPPHYAGRQPASSLLVAPFVFIIPEKTKISPNFEEVASAFWIPQSYLTNPENYNPRAIFLNGMESHLPGIQVSGKWLWGFTLSVLTTYLNHPLIS